MKNLNYRNWVIAALLCVISPISASAQSSDPFATAIQVNDRVITNYELTQRALMLRLFQGNDGPLRREIAQEQLINERLYLQAGVENGINLSDAELADAKSEFAARANLTTEEFLTILAQNEISAQTYHDFIKAGLTWRSVVRARFARQTTITDEDIDNSLNLASDQSGSQFLLAEIVIPEGSVAGETARQLATRLSTTLSSGGGFSNAARRYSRAPSAGRGGQLNWVSAGSLPPTLVAQLLTLSNGEVSGPIELNGSIAIFQLRNKRISKSDPLVSSNETVAYSILTLADQTRDARNTAATQRVIRTQVDTCLDLQAIAPRYGSLSEGAGAVAELPSDVALAISKLDIRETMDFRNSSGQATVLMLCSRTKDFAEGEKEQIRSSLFNQKVSSLGAGYLQELKGEAFIEVK